MKYYLFIFITNTIKTNVAIPAKARYDIRILTVFLGITILPTAGLFTYHERYCYLKMPRKRTAIPFLGIQSLFPVDVSQYKSVYDFD